MALSLSHPMLTSQAIMQDLCKPLFAYTPCDFFDYERFYFDGRWFNVNTHDPKLIHHYDELQLQLPMVELIRRVNTSDFLSCQLPVSISTLETPQLTDEILLHSEFELNDRIYFYSKHDNYIEVAGFGISAENTFSAKQNYFMLQKNTPVLLAFKAHFITQAEALLNQQQEASICLGQEHVLQPISLPSTDEFCQLAEYLQEQKLATVNTLTCREQNCLALYARGYTAKEIGGMLKLSYRTVEKHIQNIKAKLGSLSRQQLRTLL